MDNTQLMYLLGAFLFGFFIAWFAGRNGPKRALEDSETESDSLRRSLEEQKRAGTKLEAQVNDGLGQIDRLSADKTQLTEMLKASEKGLTDASGEIGRLQAKVDSVEGNRLLLEAELGHTRGAFASARSRAAALSVAVMAQAVALEEVEEVLVEEIAAEVEMAEELAEDEALLMEYPPALMEAELEAVGEELDALKSELAAARAAAERLSAEKAIRAELLGASREKYFALADDPVRAVIALQERDMAIIEAQSKAEYLRRDLGRMSASGAEMARALNKRNREYEILLARLSELTAAEPSRLVDFAATTEQIATPAASEAADMQQAAEQQEPSDFAAKLAAQTAVANELQSQLETLQSELGDFRTQVDTLQNDKADLEAQLQTREDAVTDLNTQLAAVQATLATLQSDNSTLENQLQARDAGLDDVLAKIAALDLDLSALADAPTGEEAPTTEAEADTAAADEPIADEEAPEQETQSDPTDAVKQRLAALSVGVAAVAAALQGKKDRIEIMEASLGQASQQEDALRSELDAKDQNLNDLQTKLNSLATDLTSRSAKFDAVSLRSNSLEADIEIERINRGKFETQVAQIAAQLNDLAAEFADQDAATAFEPEAAPTAEAEVGGTATPVDLSASSSDETQTATAEQSQPSTAPEVDAQETADASLSGQQIEAPADDAPQVEAAPDTLAALTAGASAVAAIMRKKVESLNDSRSQIAALQAQIGDLTTGKDDLVSSVAEKESALADVQAQVEKLQSDLDARIANLDELNLQLAGLQTDLDSTRASRTELESTLQELDSQFVSLLDQYGEAADQPVADEAQDAAPGEEAPAEGTEAPADGDDSSVDSAADKPGIIPAAAAVSAILKRKSDSLDEANVRIASLEGELGALTSEKTDLISNLEEQQNGLADAELQIESLQTDLTTRLAELDELNTKVTALEATLSETSEAKSQVEAELAEGQQAIESLNQQIAELQQSLDETSAAKDRAAADLKELTDSLDDLGQLADADEDDAETEERFSQRTASIAAVGGSTAAFVALKRKQETLKEQDAQVAALSTQLAEVQAELESMTSAKEQAESDSQEKQQEIESLNQQIAELQQSLDETSAAKDQAAADLKELTDSLDDLGQLADADEDDPETEERFSQRTASIAAVGGSTAAFVALKRKQETLKEQDAQVAALSTQLAEVQAELESMTSAKEQAESDSQEKQQAIESLNQQIAELQQSLDETSAAKDKAAADLKELTDSLDDLGQLADADEDDAETEERFSQRTASVAAVGGSTAAFVALKRKQETLKEQDAQVAALQQQIEELTNSRGELESQFSQRLVEQDTLAQQINELQESLATTQKDKSETEDALLASAQTLESLKTEQDALVAQLDATRSEQASIQALVDQRNSELTEVKAQLMASTAWQEKTPALVELGRSLAQLGGFKAAAANAAVDERAMPKITDAPDDLAEVHGIGTKFEQRLYGAGVGSFWEMANLSDEEFIEILEISEIQLLHMDFDAIRTDAARLAREKSTVGIIWDGDAPDDFEPIVGIGKVFEQRLYNAGIRTYAALAAATPDQLAAIAKARKPLEPDFESWIEQAKTLADQKSG